MHVTQTSLNKLLGCWHECTCLWLTCTRGLHYLTHMCCWHVYKHYVCICVDMHAWDWTCHVDGWYKTDMPHRCYRPLRQLCGHASARCDVLLTCMYFVRRGDVLPFWWRSTELTFWHVLIRRGCLLMACNAYMHVHIRRCYGWDSLRFWFAQFRHVDTDMQASLGGFGSRHVLSTQHNRHVKLTWACIYTWTLLLEHIALMPTCVYMWISLTCTYVDFVSCKHYMLTFLTCSKHGHACVRLSIPN